MQYKTVIVDDERLARKEMRRLLVDFDEITVVGEAENITKACDLINEEKPDLVFLDIQLTNENGFELLEKASVNFKVIFVTAFDSYAIRAFEVNALDYLLKPVNPKRLEKAIRRLNEETGEPKEFRSFDFDDRVLCETGERSIFLKICDISHIDAVGDYSNVFTVEKKRYLIEKSLREWERRLPEKFFLRVHRQTIINLEQIETIQTLFNRTLDVRLKHYSQPLSVSRRYSVKIKNRFS